MVEVTGRQIRCITRRDFVESLAIAPFISLNGQILSGVGGAVSSAAPVGSQTVPNLAALPVPATNDVPNWNAFPATSWALNTPFTDTTTAVMRRLTNATFPNSNLGIGTEYATSGMISRPWGAGWNQYHFMLMDNNANYWVLNYQLGVGVDQSGTAFNLTAITGLGAGLLYCFSHNPSEPHIIYFSDEGTPSSVHRYDVNAKAYAPNAVFTGATAALATTAPQAGALNMTWDGTMLALGGNFNSPSVLVSINVVTGNIVTYTGSAVQGDLHRQFYHAKISSYGILVSGNPSENENFYFRSVNFATADTSGVYAGHQDFGGANLYCNDPNPSNFPLQVITPGSAPGSDGGAWTGGVSLSFNGTSQDAFVCTDGHASMAWDQTAAGGGSGEYYCFDTMNSLLGGSLGIFMNQADGWSVHSGNIYTTTVTLNSAYGGVQRGVRSVQVMNGQSCGFQGSISGTVLTVTVVNYGKIVNGANCIDGYFGVLTPFQITSFGTGTGGTGTYNISVSQSGSSAGIIQLGGAIIGNLAVAANLGAMTAGSFYWDGTNLYVWMPDNSNPAGSGASAGVKVRLCSFAKIQEAIGYARQDGGDLRRLCNTYREDEDNTYQHGAFTCFSPDGKLAIFNSNLGTCNNRIDAVAVEVPLH